MAAHCLTAIKEVLEYGVTISHLTAALNYSCWTEDLIDDDYKELDTLVNRTLSHPLAVDEVYNWFVKIEKKYADLWTSLNCPSNRETWIKNSREKFVKEHYLVSKRKIICPVCKKIETGYKRPADWFHETKNKFACLDHAGHV